MAANSAFSAAAKSVVKRNVFASDDDEKKKWRDVEEKDKLDNIMDTADDEWWHTADNPASPLAGDGSPLGSPGGGSFVPVPDGEEHELDFSDDEEHFPDAEDYSEAEIKATKTMQRYGRRFLARLRGEVFSSSPTSPHANTKSINVSSQTHLHREAKSPLYNLKSPLSWKEICLWRE
jgi:hypothetical protein